MLNGKNYMEIYVKSVWKGYNKSVNSWIDKKRQYKWMAEYFPEPNSLGRNVKVKLDLSSYATKADLENSNRRWYIIFC